jgi:hypothetical protein
VSPRAYGCSGGGAVCACHLVGACERVMAERGEVLAQVSTDSCRYCDCFMVSLTALSSLWLQGIDLTMAINISAASLTIGSSLPDIVAELTGTWGTAPADARTHRRRTGQHRRPRAPAAPAHHGRAPIDRRLRHRTLIPRPPSTPPPRRDQDRQILHHPPLPKQRRRGDRTLHRRARR